MFAEPFIFIYNDAVWFHALYFDFQNITITMDSVTGIDTIRFSNEIIFAAFDGKEHISLGGNGLQIV